MSRTRFEMYVPSGWAPDCGDVDGNLPMVYFAAPKTGTTWEGVHVRNEQPASFALSDFGRWCVAAEGHGYAG